MPTVDRNDENATRYETEHTQPGITLEEQIVFMQADLAADERWLAVDNDNPEAQEVVANVKAILASLIRLKDIEGKLREPTPEMLKAGAECKGMEQINSWVAEMQVARGRVPNWTADNPPLAQAWKAMSALMLRGNP